MATLPQNAPPSRRLWAAALVASLALAWTACAGDQVDPDLDPSGVDAADEGDGNLTKADKPAKAAKADGNSANSADSANGDDDKETKTAIADDGYDDNWNNVGSQQQNAKNTKNSKNDKNQQNASNAEPPLKNEVAEAPKNAAAEPPPANQPPNEVPAAEPPLDQEPAPVASEPPSTPAPAPTPVSAPTDSGFKPIASGAPLVKADMEPVTARLFWVGYDYLEKEGIVRIEMVTRGSPKFNLFQERNQANQPELVVRFFNTRLRAKLRRDIDASEFRSPVAFVRLRPDEGENSVDVVMTLRDNIQPRMFTKFGNVMLTFPLPDRYFGNSTIGTAPVAKAEVLPNANIMPDIDHDSEIPEGLKLAKAFINNPGQDAFKDAPPGGGQPVQAASGDPDGGTPKDPAALPLDFDAGNKANQGAVGQDAAGTNSGLGEGSTPKNDLGSGAQNKNGANAAPASDGGDDPFGAGGDTGAGGGANDFNTGGNGAGGANAPGPNVSTPAADSFGDGEPPLPGAGSAPAPEPAPAEPASGGEGDGSDQDELNGDKLEDFDNGKGDSKDEIDKFNVRAAPASAPYALAAAAVLVTPFSMTGVAQDDDFGVADAAAGGGGGNPAGGGGNPAGGGNNTGGNGAAAGGANGANGAAAGAANAGANAGGANADFPAAGNQAAGPANTGNGNLLGDGGGSNAGGANAGPPPPGPTAFGGNNAANGAAGSGNASPAGGNVTNAALTPDTGGAAAGEPPVDGAPDLAGEEKEGSASEANPEPASGGGRPMRLDFRGAPLTEVIRVLSEESHVNFVMPPEIGAKQVYLNLNGVPFNDALKAILESNGLGIVALGQNLVRIDTVEKIAQGKESEERRRKAELKLRPTKILVHRLSFAKAIDAARMLGQMLGAASQEDKRITVEVDERTNAVIVNAPPGELATIKALLERIDLETPQVKIASRIVEVIKTFSDAFGISWGMPLNYDQGRGLGFGNLVFPNYMLSRYSVDAGGKTAAANNLQFRFGSVNNSTALDLALSMEEQRGTSEVLQSSNLVVEDNQDAEIVAGRSDYFRPPAGGVQVGGNSGGLDEVTYNLTMKVKPHVTAEGSVQMVIKVESDDPSPPAVAGGGAVAAKNNRQVSTIMTKRSGDTVVIGGLYNTTRAKDQTGVPFLSSLPIIGALFRKSSNNEQKRELMVMVTPTIITASKAFTSGDGGGGGGSDGEENDPSPAAAAVKDAGASNANFGSDSPDGGDGGGGSGGNVGNNSLGAGLGNGKGGNAGNNAPNAGGGNNNTGGNNDNGGGGDDD